MGVLGLAHGRPCTSSACQDVRFGVLMMIQARLTAHLRHTCFPIYYVIFLHAWRLTVFLLWMGPLYRTCIHSYNPYADFYCDICSIHYVHTNLRSVSRFPAHSRYVALQQRSCLLHEVSLMETCCYPRAQIPRLGQMIRLRVASARSIMNLLPIHPGVCRASGACTPRG